MLDDCHKLCHSCLRSHKFVISELHFALYCIWCSVQGKACVQFACLCSAQSLCQKEGICAWLRFNMHFGPVPHCKEESHKALVNLSCPRLHACGTQTEPCTVIANQVSHFWCFDQPACSGCWPTQTCCLCCVSCSGADHHHILHVKFNSHMNMLVQSCSHGSWICTEDVLVVIPEAKTNSAAQGTGVCS